MTSLNCSIFNFPFYSCVYILFNIHTYIYISINKLSNFPTSLGIIKGPLNDEWKALSGREARLPSPSYPNNGSVIEDFPMSLHYVGVQVGCGQEEEKETLMAERENLRGGIDSRSDWRNALALMGSLS